tara:strand:+ start:39 stop:302 length:264 start_codon:yes stop_codon:yes gene_type:complete
MTVSAWQPPSISNTLPTPPEQEVNRANQDIRQYLPRLRAGENEALAYNLVRGLREAGVHEDTYNQASTTLELVNTLLLDFHRSQQVS